MKIYCDLTKIPDFSNRHTFIDTNVLIGALNNSVLVTEVLSKARKLMTIPSVAFEFSRGANNLDVFNKRLDFLSGLGVTVYPIERHFLYTDRTIPVFQRVAGRMSYTDCLLCACLYKLKGCYLLTSDFATMPLEILERECIVTIDGGKEITNYAFYSLSEEKFEKVATKILA